ncbi:biopolymer transporter ExbD [Microcoleus sp. FACHB-1515]|uniref:ExbD/TolR family protein n=1 Tax=Cyanophyceae TaxID=3028117 RepID=UPI001688C927|nr:biopolymer transporter ExbD [Microcoleus sp. FACHB-1515]MBD2090746.1 biopolymer transporter ExbD [Microcoleus sp. FACHB-1515]
MKLKQDTSGPDVRIEIVPLIDVVFCILTFFILAALGLTRQQAINVDLPRASTGVAQMRDLFIVSVDPIGQTYIDQQPVTRDQLQQALTEYNQQKPDGLIVLYASQQSQYSDVVGVLDLLRSVGGDRVALATLPGSTPIATPNEPLLPTNPQTAPGAGLPGSNIPGGAIDPFDPNQNLFPGASPLPTPGSATPSPVPTLPTAPGTATPRTAAPGASPTNPLPKN